MERIIKPLNLMGASIKSNNGFPPLKFPEKPVKLNGIKYFILEMDIFFLLKH